MRTVLLVLALAAATPSQFALEGASAVGNGNPAKSLAVADIDGDGLDDVVAISQQGLNSVGSVWLATPSGAFVAGATGSLPLGSRAPRAGDLNGDGAIDFAFAHALGLVWLPGDGTGAWGAPILFHPAVFPRDVILADLDGDGDLDAASITTSAVFLTHEVSVHLNDGTGGFAPAAAQATLNASGLAAGDADGDGDLDLVVAATGGVTYLVNDGSGSFSTGGTVPLTGTIADRIATGDLDGDGNADFALWRGTGSTQDVHVLMSLGNGTFTARPLPRGVHGASMVIGDLDGDGDQDLLGSERSGTNQHASTVAWLNDGTGVLAASKAFDPSLGAASEVDAVLIDLENDGDADVAVGWQPTGVAPPPVAAAFVTMRQTPLGRFAAGNLGVSAGGPFDVLTVNGSAGGVDRTVPVGLGQPITLQVAQPTTNPAPAAFSLYGFIGVPGWAHETVLPFNIGTSVYAPCTVDLGGGSFNIIDSIFPPPCGSIFAPVPAPWTSPASPGIPIPVKITLEVFIFEDASTVAVGNAVLIDVS